MTSRKKRSSPTSLPPFPVQQAVALLLLLIPGTGCNTYRQAGIAELPAEQRVRMLLTPEELGRHIRFSSGNQGYVNGRFVEVRGDSAVFVLTSHTAHSQVSLHLGSIVRLERKDANHGRSFLLSAAIVGGVATLAYLGFEGEQNTAPNPDDDLTDQFAPGIRIVIPLGR